MQMQGQTHKNQSKRKRNEEGAKGERRWKDEREKETLTNVHPVDRFEWVENHQNTIWKNQIHDFLGVFRWLVCECLGA